jgi:putative copper resistance protein D
MTPAWVEVLIRLAQFGFGLVLFGLPAFALYRRRGWDAAQRGGGALRAALMASATGLLVVAAAAALALTVNMYGTLADALDVEALWSVLTGLQVGMALGVRLGLTTVFLLIVLVMSESTSQRSTLLVVGGLIVASFAWSGHGAATEGTWALVHLASDVFHLLAASIWIGALLVLIASLARASAPRDAAMALDDLKTFSALGTVAVLVIVVTGLINSAVLVGWDRVGQMATHPYGQILLAKIALFAAMLGLAAAHRFILVPRLESQHLAPGAALSRLKVSVGIETILGFMVLLAVAAMGRMSPMAAG